MPPSILLCCSLSPPQDDVDDEEEDDRESSSFAGRVTIRRGWNAPAENPSPDGTMADPLLVGGANMGRSKPDPRRSRLLVGIADVADAGVPPPPVPVPAVRMLPLWTDPLDIRRSRPMANELSRRAGLDFTDICHCLSMSSEPRRRGLDVSAMADIRRSRSL